MKDKIIEQLNNLGWVLHKEAETISNLRNDCVRKREYNLANDMLRMQGSILDLHSAVIRHLEDLTYIPPNDGKANILKDNVD